MKKYTERKRRLYSRTNPTRVPAYVARILFVRQRTEVKTTTAEWEECVTPLPSSRTRRVRGQWPSCAHSRWAQLLASERRKREESEGEREREPPRRGEPTGTADTRATTGTRGKERERGEGGREVLWCKIPTRIFNGRLIPNLEAGGR